MVKRLPKRIALLVFVLSVPSASFASDSDGDGVDDSIDVCCATPPGLEVDDHGRPKGDLDGDCDVDLYDYRILSENFTGPLAEDCPG